MLLELLAMACAFFNKGIVFQLVRSEVRAKSLKALGILQKRSNKIFSSFKISSPISNIADLSARLLADGTEKNIYLDLTLLLLFGLLQYAFLGYLIGRVAKYLFRSSGHAAGNHDQ